MECNIIVEIFGIDFKDEVVIFGVYFDSWYVAIGVMDNGVGFMVMMEVVCILQEVIKEIGVKFCCMLCLVLWIGEEQGLYGSWGYVGEYYVEFLEGIYNLQLIKLVQEKVFVYYNFDNGIGKICGVYLQGNQAVSFIFCFWLEFFKDFEVGIFMLFNIGGIDYLVFDVVGILGFQFIQDFMAYFICIYYSNMDNLDYLVEDDFK